MHKEPILYVDDEEINLILFKEFFCNDYDVLTANSAKEGLKIIEINDKIKVIISDLKMPIMDGFEFIEKVKESYPDKICLILSAYNMDDQIKYQNVKDLIFRYMNKPLQKPLMDRVLKSAVESYKDLF